MRLLAVPTSGSSIERTWSTFSFIHDRRRNCLAVPRASALVDIFTTMHLRRRRERADKKGEADPSIPWLWFEEGLWSESEEGGEEEEDEEPGPKAREEAEGPSSRRRVRQRIEEDGDELSPRALRYRRRGAPLIPQEQEEEAGPSPKEGEECEDDY